MHRDAKMGSNVKRFGGNIGWIGDYGKAVSGTSCVARAALQLHSIKRRSRCTAVFPGVSVLSKPTPALSKCLKLKCRVTPAGRRRFESVSRSMFSISYRDLDFLLKPSNGVQRFLLSCKLLILNGPAVKNASLSRWHSLNAGNSLNLRRSDRVALNDGTIKGPRSVVASQLRNRTRYRCLLISGSRASEAAVRAIGRSRGGIGRCACPEGWFPRPRQLV